MTGPLRDARAMLAALDPALDTVPYVFATTADPDRAAAATPRALGLFREAEGVTLILPADQAHEFGFDASAPMRRITLRVASALDGVGLTAAVAAALASEGVACNMIGAFHHDHVFTPAADAGRALAILEALQSDAL